MPLDQRAYIKDVFLADRPAAILERNRRCSRHAQQYEPVFLGTQGGYAIITSAPRLAATSAPPALGKGRPPPSATAPHRLPVAWPRWCLLATTQTAPSRAVSVPASIPGRHS